MNQGNEIRSLVLNKVVTGKDFCLKQTQGLRVLMATNFYPNFL